MAKEEWEGGRGNGEKGQGGVPVPALAFPLLDQLDLTHRLSCLASVSPKVKGDVGL